MQQNKDASLVAEPCAKLVSHAGGPPSLGAPFSSGPAPAFGAVAFGAGASGPSQNPNPFQPAPFTAGGGGGFGQQQQSGPTGFGATNTAGARAQHNFCLVNVQSSSFDQYGASSLWFASMLHVHALPDLCIACMLISCCHAI